VLGLTRPGRVLVGGRFAGLLSEWGGQVVEVVAAAGALRLEVMLRELRVVELLHRQRAGDEGGPGGALGDPEVDGGVDGQVDDVVGGEAQPFLFWLVDRDVV
jgi:hypothetical protein